MKKILITGANSYIGTSFEKYINDNYPAEYIVDTVDMLDDSWREKSFSGYDAVFHVAGIAHIKETKDNAHLYYEVNRNLAIETAQKSAACGVKQFVFLSSMSVYGLLNGMIDKETEMVPKNNYGKSKLAAEEELNKLVSDELKISIIRPPMVYGTNCKGNFVSLQKIAKTIPIFPYVNNKRSMIYIENLCEFIRLIIDAEESGIFCPQNAEYTNTTEMIKAIACANGKKVILVKGFSFFIKLLCPFVNVISKAFGDLYYEQSLSEYKENYQIFSIKDSIERIGKD